MFGVAKKFNNNRLKRVEFFFFIKMLIRKVSKIKKKILKILKILSFIKKVWYVNKKINKIKRLMLIEVIFMIISQLSISPIGVGISLSKYVKIAIDILKKNNVKFKINDMATVIETKDLSTLFKIVEDAHAAIINSGVERVIIELKIDDRRDKMVTIGTKVKSVQ